MIKFFIPLFLTVSCAAVFVSETKNADKKIEQAFRLLQENRRPMAKKLIEDAMTIYRKEDNKEGVAKAYLHLAEVYKEGVTKDLFKVGDSYEKAADINHSLKSHMSESLILWSAGYWYGQAQQKDSACRAFTKSHQALSLKEKAKDLDKFTATEDFPARIRQLEKKFGCK